MAKIKGLSGNLLKIIGAIFMVIDHIGVILFPDVLVLRILGRIAFPIFALMIYEGSRYTKNKLRYFLVIFILSLILFAVDYAVNEEIFFNVLTTFSLSILLIYLVQCAKKVSSVFAETAIYIALLASLTAIFFLCRVVIIDYGFAGILLPVLPAITDNFFKYKGDKLFIFTPQFWLFAVGIGLLAIEMLWIEYWAFVALIPLAFYNGQKGFYLPKYSFYVFYPLHVAIIYGISLII